jgi:hypothetical protein
MHLFHHELNDLIKKCKNILKVKKCVHKFIYVLFIIVSIHKTHNNICLMIKFFFRLI